MNVVTTVIKSRHSVRKFKPDPVNDIVIKDAIECAAHAPTAMNLQPWLFGVIKNKEMLEKIAQITDHGKFIADAPSVLQFLGKKKKNIISRIVVQPRKISFWLCRHMASIPAGWRGKRSRTLKLSGRFLGFRKNIR